MKKILIEIGHPAHVHQFRNLYKELVSIGWEGLFVTKEKEFTIDLLKYYDLPYVVLGKTKQGMLSKVLSLPGFAIKMFKVARQFKPDIFISRVSPLSGWSSFLLRKSHITFTDTENVQLMDAFSEPFADVVLTSTTYLRKHGKKHLKYPGYHELAYLHPNRFTPDSKILESLNVKENERYAIVRFVAWAAHHDVGMKGFTFENKLRLVKELSKHLRVFISSEDVLPEELMEYQIKIKPEDMHDVLAFADFFVGESSTMASESVVLGTPALFMSDISFGCINDQISYGLLEQFSISEEGQEKMIKRAISLAEDDKSKKKYEINRERLLNDKIDMTSFMSWFVVNYPKSVEDWKQRKVSWEQFK